MSSEEAVVTEVGNHNKSINQCYAKVKVSKSKEETRGWGAEAWMLMLLSAPIYIPQAHGIM